MTVIILGLLIPNGRGEISKSSLKHKTIHVIIISYPLPHSQYDIGIFVVVDPVLLEVEVVVEVLVEMTVVLEVC